MELGCSSVYGQGHLSIRFQGFKNIFYSYFVFFNLKFVFVTFCCCGSVLLFHNYFSYITSFFILCSVLFVCFPFSSSSSSFFFFTVPCGTEKPVSWFKGEGLGLSFCGRSSKSKLLN